ncbi:MAG: ABC transporter ATP-binding protein [Candidatus Heimdallarchaeota archaeon]|nr:ABC transporter ATP-binding protein [Candidatus Heimdallarchaeota archaeon]
MEQLKEEMFKMKVEIKDLTKQYRKKIVLNNVNLVIPKGKITVILGPSGSGKTTLLRLIAGLLHPTSGEIFFNKTNVTNIPANKRNIAMVFQNYPLFPHMTVKENLKFPLESKKDGKIFRTNVYSKDEIEKKVNDISSLLHIEEHMDKYPSQLSGGEKQRVAIGRELIRDPDIFLLDEPLSNIDARLRYEMRSWIRKLHEMLEKTMIYVTHDQSEAMALGDWIVLLDEGKIVQVGTPDELYYDPHTRFVAQFIGNYPMNFLPFVLDKQSCYIDGERRELISGKTCKTIQSKGIPRGTIGFRAETIREFNQNKPLERDVIKLECIIEDVEKVLDQQILTVIYSGIQLFYVTKTKKKFSKKDSIIIILHHDNIYIFDENLCKID